MNSVYLISALALGFLGSFHCAGMCGPLLLMMPLNNSSTQSAIVGKIIYNTGRITSYVFMGFIFGIFGLTIALQGFQRELSIFTGCLIIIITLFTLSNKFFKSYKFTNYYMSHVRKYLKMLYSKKTFTSMFLIGALNGFLPCGFVYLALAGAAASASIYGGMTYMLLFGLGTFPMMMILTLATNFFGVKFSRFYSRVSPIIAIVLAGFLIFRGIEFKNESCCKDHSVITEQSKLAY